MIEKRKRKRSKTSKVFTQKNLLAPQPEPEKKEEKPNFFDVTPEDVLGFVVDFEGMLYRLFSKLTNPIFKFATKNKKTLGISLLILAILTLVMITLTVVFTTMGIVGLMNGSVLWTNIWLFLALLSLTTGFGIVGLLIEIASWAALTIKLLKAGFIDSQIQSLRVAFRKLGQFFKWTRETIASAVKLVAGAAPGANKEKIAEAFHHEAEAVAEPIKIFGPLEEAFQEIVSKAKRYADAAKKTYVIWAVCLIDFIVANVLIHSAHLSQPVYFWHSAGGIFSVLLFAVLVVWAILYPPPKPIPGYIKHFRLVGTLLALIIVWEGSGYFLGWNKVVAVKTEKTDLRNQFLAVQQSYENEKIANQTENLELVAVGDHPALNDSTFATTGDSTMIIHDGSKWILDAVVEINTTGHNAKMVVVHQGIASHPIQFGGEIGWFVPVKETKPHESSSTQLVSSSANAKETIYDYRQGEMDGSFPNGTVLTPTVQGALVWDPACTDGSGNLNGANRTPRSCTHPKEFPAMDLPWGALIINTGTGWDLFNKPITVSGTVKIDCNDRLNHRGDNGGSVLILVSTRS